MDEGRTVVTEGQETFWAFLKGERTVETEGQETFWAFLKGERCLANERADTSAIGWLWIRARHIQDLSCPDAILAKPCGPS